MAGNPILLITAPDISHAKALHELFQDEDLQHEFPQLRPRSVENAREFLDKQTDLVGGKITFFRLIKIGYSPDPAFHGADYTDLIGFVTVAETGMGDFVLSSGLNHLLSFAVARKYRNMGVMTTALKMTIDAMIQYEFNFIGAIVKSGNVSSERVLSKCGFDKVQSTAINSTFIRRLCMSLPDYNKHFRPAMS